MYRMPVIQGPSRGIMLRSWRRFWQHLAEQQFGVPDPAYRFFVPQLFHDGEVALVSLDLRGGKVHMEFTNVSAIDRVCDHHGKHWGAIRRDDFRTNVWFEGVRELRLTRDRRIEAPLIYIRSGLDRAKNGTRLRIECESGTRFAQAAVVIVYSKLVVEDISPKISKYLAPKERTKVAEYITWIKHGPAWYRDHQDKGD